LDAIKDVCRPWPSHALRSERFTGQDSDDAMSRTSFQVTLKRSGVVTTVGANETVLDAVRAAGAEILSSCRQGTCGTCETTVLAGQPDHRDSILQDHERQAGDCMFPCVSRSLTDHLVLDL
jgi:ferredoxin